MDFASGWLDRKALFPEFIQEAPQPDTGIIIVVPAYNEPGISALFDSIARCIKPDCSTEVLIVVNSPPVSRSGPRHFNEATSSAVRLWKSNNPDCFFRLYEFTVDTSRFSGWGVGMARKAGMDEAVRRFGRTGRSDGVIASLDADCTVETNYLEQLCEEFLKKRKKLACSLYFEHPLSGTGFPDLFSRAVTLYELHMRYYYQALKYTGFPYAFHTVGSAFAVKALPYIKSGGMNRRQAGEDFYFIQKLLPSGGYFSLNSTTIYPSPRSSERVPFGTGATIARMAERHSCYLETYNIKAFEELKRLFEMIEIVYQSINRDSSLLYNELPETVRSFVSNEEWRSNVAEISDNTAGFISFRKRFFSWFNMLRIVRYLNAVHISFCKKVPVAGAAGILLARIGINVTSDDPSELLMIYRSMERNDQ